jgi:hypothetical protein
MDPAGGGRGRSCSSMRFSPAMGRHGASHTTERVRSVANICKPVTAIGMVSRYIPAKARTPSHAARTGFDHLRDLSRRLPDRNGDWGACHTAECGRPLHCLEIMPRGVQVTAANPPPVCRPG